MPVATSSVIARCLSCAALALLLAVPTLARAGVQEDARAENAVRVLREIQQVPETSIPNKLLDEARAIVIVPDAIKAGLVIGGSRGHGLMSVRQPAGTWSNPSFVRLTGGSIGLQAGVQSSDIVLVFSSERGLDTIVNGKFTLGADAAVAAGPVGRNAALATGGELKAEIWSWSRARGLFAGVSLKGAVLAIDDAANQAVYGQGTTPRMIFEDRAAQPPSTAVVAFRDALEEATAAAHAARNVEAAPATAATPAAIDSTLATPATQTLPASSQPVGAIDATAPVTSEPLPAAQPQPGTFQPADAADAVVTQPAPMPQSAPVPPAAIAPQPASAPLPAPVPQDTPPAPTPTP